VQILYFHDFIEELERLDKDVQKQIKSKLKELYRTPFGQLAPLALKGAQFKGLFKLRMGDWRLIQGSAERAHLRHSWPSLGSVSEVDPGVRYKWAASGVGDFHVTIGAAS